MWWEVLSPVLANVLAIAATAMIGWAATAIHAKFGVEVEASYRDSLHSAIMSGVQAGLARVGGLVAPLKPNVRLEVIDSAVNYAQRSVPEAIQALNPAAAVLADLAASKLNMIATAQQPISPIVATATGPNLPRIDP